jgi:hypothetical protein
VEALDAERLSALIGDQVDAILERYDEDGDAAISMAEVSERQWDRLSSADADEDDSVSLRKS